MRFSDAVRDARKKKGLTQEELGKAVGLSRGSIGGIESELFNPLLVTALRISNFLGFSLNLIEPLDLDPIIRRKKRKSDRITKLKQQLKKLEGK